MSMSGRAGEVPNPPGAAIADTGGGLQLALACMTALVARSITGRGQVVRTSSLGMQLWLQQWEIQHAAMTGSPLTREDYHASRWIVRPFHLFDCCPENDGAAAALLTTPERARDLRKTPVPVVATAQGLGPDFGTSAFQSRWFPGMFYAGVGEAIWQRAGVGPSDIDALQMYENFSGPVAMAICELGFCKPEEIGASSSLSRWM